jgi:hypothetical protein
MTVPRALPSTLLLLGGLLAASPAIAAAPPRAALSADSAIVQVQATATAGGTVTVRSKEGYAKLHASPSTSSEVLDKVTQGTKLEVIAKSGGWTQVKFGDKTGYVNNHLVTR